MTNTSINYTLLLAAAVLLSTSAAPAAQTLFEDQSYESIRVEKGSGEDAGLIFNQTKVNYHPVTLWGNATDDKPRHIIVRETIRTSQQEESEGEKSSLKVDFFNMAASGKYPKTPSQTITIDAADESKFQDDGWTATSFGCCDQESYTRFYTYGADKPFLRYNGDYWKVEVPNDHPKDRYVAIAIKQQVASDTAREFLFGKQPKAIACLQLGGGGKLLDTVYLQPRKSVSPKHIDDMTIHSDRIALTGTGEKDEADETNRILTLWSMDGAVDANKRKKAVSGIKVTTSVYLSTADESSTPTLSVSVQNDKFVNPRIIGKWLEAAPAVSGTADSSE